jgi:N-acylneuraminate cytidylyltransferase
MIENYSVLAIIPARGGSKRILNKNRKLLAGKPLIEYSFEHAKSSKYIDRIFTITDDVAIADMSRRAGIEVPFMEPDHLAADNIEDFLFFAHTLEWLHENEKKGPDIIVQLRPTSPLRTTEHINTAIELLVAHPHVDSVRTVTEPEQSPYKMYSVGEDNLLKPLLTLPGEKESFNLPQQKLPKAYKHVGYVDVMWSKTLTEKKKMTGDKILHLILEGAVSGINTQEDWDYYEYLMSSRQ